MQNNNSEIELETIQRLQVVEQFGEDAAIGLESANKQGDQLAVDQEKQVKRHEDALQTQETKNADLKGELDEISNSLVELKDQFRHS